MGSLLTPSSPSFAPGCGFPLPPELFTQVCAHLSPSDLVVATHVSRSWRHALVNTPLLWSELVGVDLTHPKAIDRAEAVLGRAKGGLVKLQVGLPMNEEFIEQWKDHPLNVEMAVSVAARLAVVGARPSRIQRGILILSTWHRFTGFGASSAQSNETTAPPIFVT